MAYIQETAKVTSTQPLKTKGRPKPPKRLLPIRFSTRDVAVIAAGFTWIDANHEQWKAEGILPFSRPDLRWLPKAIDRGQYSEELMQRFVGLQQEAGLQPGGIQPTLRRLEEEGLLCRSEEAKRRRRSMKVTDKGARLLEHHWKDCIQDSPDIESVLRCATLAILMGNLQYAHQYLLSVADEHERNYDGAKHIASFRSRHSSPLDCYGFMRMQWQVAKRHAAEVLRQIAKEVQDMKPTHKPTSKEEEMKIQKDMRSL
jgi:DNA-binding PadR family transcriptional regulator